MSAETFSLHFAHRKQSTCHSAELEERVSIVTAKNRGRWSRSDGLAEAGGRWNLPKRDDDSAVLLVDDLLASSTASLHLAQRCDRRHGLLVHAVNGLTMRGAP